MLTDAREKDLERLTVTTVVHLSGWLCSSLQSFMLTVLAASVTLTRVA